MKNAKRFISVKYLMMFVAGLAVSLFAAYAATTIETNLSQAVQYIQKIVLTSDGGQTGATGVVLDGVSGNLGVRGTLGVGTFTPDSAYALDVNGDAVLRSGFTLMGNALLGAITYIDTGIVSHTLQSMNYCNWSGTVCKTIEQLVSGSSVWSQSGANIYYTGNIGVGISTFPLVYAPLKHFWLGSNTIFGAETGSELYVGANVYKESLTVYKRFSTGYVSMQQQYNGAHRFFTSGSGGSNSAITRGSEKMIIDNTGNVGIGTSTPSEKLDVNGNVKINGMASINGVFGSLTLSGSILSMLKIYNPTSVDGRYFGSVMSNDLIIGNSGTMENGDIIFANGSVLMSIKTGGNVGIGIPTPQTKLHVQGQVRADSGFVVNGSLGIDHCASYTGTDGNIHELQFLGGILVATGCL